MKLYQNKALLTKLYVQERMTLQEMADYMNCSVQTVKNWLERYKITKPGRR